MPLHVIVVGAGIAGLSVAIALRNAGHEVEVFEQSKLTSETGAAINICPNAARVLIPWGLDPQRAGMNACGGIFTAVAADLKPIIEADIDFNKIYGAPFYMSRRVDLHSELKLLATREDGPGQPAKIRLSSTVVNADPEKGIVTLSDGTTHSADLIVAADGVHSRFTELATGQKTEAAPSGMSAFRFLIKTEDIMNDEETRHVLEGRNEKLKIYVGEGDRRLVWYSCREGTIQNFVMIHPDSERTKSSEDWRIEADTDVLLEECRHFHSSLQSVCRKATDLNVWKLIYRPPISPWCTSRMVLVGDAAHPMLPHQGQGGAQSIEDGAALGAVLTGVESNDLAHLKSRLDDFQTIRRRRASAIQIFSNAGQDEAEKIEAASREFVDGKIPSSPQEFHRFNFGYDIWDHCKSVLAAA